MKKIISLILVCVMALSLVACGTEKPVETNAPETNAPETTAPVETTAPEAETEAPVASTGALAVLENIWNLYAEDEKFAVIGGSMAAPAGGYNRAPVGGMPSTFAEIEEEDGELPF